jgi:hypothetical protein
VRTWVQSQAQQKRERERKKKNYRNEHTTEENFPELRT